MSTRFSQSLEMGRLTATGLPKPSREAKFLGANADREKLIFPLQLTTCRMGNFTRLIHTLAICVTIHNVPEKPTVIPVNYIYRHRCFSTFSVLLVANPKKLLYTVANPAPYGVLNREIYTVAYPFLYVSGMYVWPTLSAEYGMDQPGAVASPARGHLKK